MRNSSLWIILLAIAVVLTVLLIGFSRMAKKLDGIPDKVRQIEQRVENLEKQRGMGSNRELWNKD